MDDEFIERDKEEQGNEFEEEAEEDYDYLDYEYDDIEKIDFWINQPMVTTWVGSDGTTTLEGLEVDWPILGRSKNIFVLNDVCPICFKALTGTGKHQICCLPCGHIYGRSCINQWLQQSQNYSKCPQCKSLCTLKDVTLLYTTRPCDDAVGPLPKVSTKRFPFTKQGFKAFKRYAMRRLDDESAMRLDAARRRDYVFRQCKEMYRRWYYSDAVHQPDKYKRLEDKLTHREVILDRRKWALKLRIKEYHASIDLFVQSYKEYLTREKNECKGMATRVLPRIPSQSPSLAPSPHSWIPRKVSLMVWKASRNLLGTRPILMARGVDLPSANCPFCDSDLEDIQHVLVECPRVSVVWRNVWSWWNLPPPTSFSIVDVAKGNLHVRGWPSLTKAINGVFQISLWAIWEWRNRIIRATGDDLESTKNEDIFPGIQRTAKKWMSARICPKIKIDWNCWIDRPLDLFS